MQAAEIIAWGVADGWTNLRTSLGKNGPMTEAGLAAAFHFLTGSGRLWLASGGG